MTHRGWSNAALVLTAIAAVSASPARATDLFIGTLAKEGGDIVLTRCDIAENRYVLVDARGSNAVAGARKGVLPAYGEVIADYVETGGRSMLSVERIENLTPGRSCHLVDAVEKLAAPASDVETLRARLGAFLGEVGRKTRDGDHAGALVVLRHAKALMTANRASLTEFGDQMGVATIALLEGDAIALGHLGDACAPYATARAEANRARAMADADSRDIATGLIARVDAGAARGGCAVASAPVKTRTDATLAGHYYLSGVMETGSELLLRADGGFEWFMSYGAVDMTARGVWRRDGDAVTLTAASPATGAPLFAYRRTVPWDAAAEREALRRAHDMVEEAVRAACPFRTDGWVSTPPMAMLGDAKPAPSAEVLRQRAASTRAAAIAARARVEAHVRAAMARPIPPEDRAGAAERAQPILSAWLTAKDDARAAARAAGLADPALDDPVLPAACTIPPLKEVAVDAPASWSGGIGVRVSDSKSGDGAHHVRVGLRFADGRQDMLVTGQDGLAMIPGKVAKPVVGATLHIDGLDSRDVVVTVAPVTNGILEFAVDAGQLAEPPFTTMRLTIADGALIAAELGKGRYEKRP